MTMKRLASPFILFLLSVSTFGYDMLKDDEFLKKYFTELGKNYDKRIPPTGVDGPGSPVKVTLSMFILDISEVDDSDMDFTVQFYFRQSWNDSRLRYKGKEDDLIIVRNEEDIWTPDLFFTGGREGRLEHIVHPNKMLRINPSGAVLYSIRVTVKFSCPMDLRYFPHDTHKCHMRVESYAHVRNDLDMEWGEGYIPVGAHKEITLHNFDLVGLDYSAKSETFTFGEYKMLDVNLTFKRKFGFFAIKLYVPFILLTILSLLSLWIKAEERGIRLSLLVLILYLMTNIALEINDKIPPAPYTKGTDVWIGFCESLVFAIFLEFVAVALIAGRHDNEIKESKGEILLNMESDSKEPPLKSDTLKSQLSKLVNMFYARNGGNGRRDATAYRIDKIFQIVFPLIFVFFNIVYWSFYCCKSSE